MKEILTPSTFQTIIAGLEAVGGIFGENVNKEIAKLIAQVLKKKQIRIDITWLCADIKN